MEASACGRVDTAWPGSGSWPRPTLPLRPPSVASPLSNRELLLGLRTSRVNGYLGMSPSQVRRTGSAQSKKPLREPQQVSPKHLLPPPPTRAESCSLSPQT